MLTSPIQVKRVDITDRAEVVAAVRQLHRTGRRECAIALLRDVEVPWECYDLQMLEYGLNERGLVLELAQFVIHAEGSCSVEELVELTKGSALAGVSALHLSRFGVLVSGIIVVGGWWHARRAGYTATRNWRHWQISEQPSKPPPGKLSSESIFNASHLREVRRRAEPGYKGLAERVQVGMQAAAVAFAEVGASFSSFGRMGFSVGDVPHPGDGIIHTDPDFVEPPAHLREALMGPPNFMGGTLSVGYIVDPDSPPEEPALMLNSVDIVSIPPGLSEEWISDRSSENKRFQSVLAGLRVPPEMMGSKADPPLRAGEIEDAEIVEVGDVEESD